MRAPPGARRADPQVRRCAKRRRAQEALTWIKSRNLLSWEWALGHPRWQLTKPLNWSTQFTKPLNLRTQNHQTFQIENPNRQTSQIVPTKRPTSQLERPNHQTQHKDGQGTHITSESIHQTLCACTLPNFLIILEGYTESKRLDQHCELYAIEVDAGKLDCNLISNAPPLP